MPRATKPKADYALEARQLTRMIGALQRDTVSDLLWRQETIDLLIKAQGLMQKRATEQILAAQQPPSPALAARLKSVARGK